MRVAVDQQTGQVGFLEEEHVAFFHGFNFTKRRFNATQQDPRFQAGAVNSFFQLFAPLFVGLVVAVAGLNAAAQQFANGFERGVGVHEVNETLCVHVAFGFKARQDDQVIFVSDLGKLGVDFRADVLEFLAPLSDPNWQPPVEEDVDEDTPENMPVIPTAPFVTEQIPEPVNRIPLKSPALYDTPATQVPVTPEVFIPPAAMPVMAQPTPVTTPVFEPAPVGYGVPTTPAPTPTYSSTQPAMSAPTLSPIPSYTPAPTPPVAPPPAPAPDRPRWSTEI